MNIEEIKSIFYKNKRDITNEEILFLYENCFKYFDYIRSIFVTESHAQFLVADIIRHLVYKEFRADEYVYHPGKHF